MITQTQATTWLKSKGTGPEMGKHLSTEAISQLDALFQSTQVHLTTKTTLLVAILMLPPTPEEQVWITHIHNNYSQILPQDTHWLVTSPNTPIQTTAAQVIAYKDLTSSDAERAFDMCLDPRIPELDKAALLEALRLKRETPEENIACLIRAHTHCQSTMLDTDTLVHFSDPFDGFNRNHYLTPFTAALLASVGIPSVITGTHSVGPKYGINTHILLKTAAKNPLLSVSDVQNQIQTPSIGWGYCDQSQYNPPMEALTSLRQNMVKRPLLATIDKLILPFTAPTTLVVAGYTHPPYKAKLARLLEVHPASPKGLILRGIEGSTQLPTGKRAPATPLGSEETLFSRPEDFGLTPIDNHTNPDITASETISEGITALKGVHGGAKATILYNALGIIKALGKFNQSTLGQLTKNLTNGSAVSHWELGHQ